jgi:hypothetical protein
MISKIKAMNETFNHEFISIAILETMIEAQLIDSILNEQNIPHQIRSFHDTAYDGLFQVQKGWGELRAPTSHKQEILKIIDIVRSKNANLQK